MTDDLTRVVTRLAPAVLSFIRAHRAGERFTSGELGAYVTEHNPGTAPGSPCRVLRLLRLTGGARVECVDQSAGLYEVVEPPPEAAWRHCLRDGHAYAREDDHECARCGEDRGGYQSSLFSGERFE